jgi:hypothetical protein
MLTVDILRDLFKGVVEAHIVGIAWTSNWTQALDADHDLHYPACVWAPPSTGIVVDNGFAYDTITIDCAFVDTTDSDRSQDQRDNAYERMEALARQCFYRFRQLYILDSTTYQGVEIDLGIETSPVLTAIWDEAGRQTTGVRLTLTVKNNIPTPCFDGFFS